jgi:hypothetical protein
LHKRVVQGHSSEKPTKVAQKEDGTMYDPARILSWLVANVQQMRQSRRKTLAAIVSAALLMRGVGVLALGRAMSGEVAAKHCIKRVWRFFRNQGLEVEALSAALFQYLRPPTGRTIILVDWTDIDPFQQLVFSFPRDGRALPFLSLTIRKGTTTAAQEGAMKEAECQGLEMLARMMPATVTPIVVADRGFGNARWLGELRKRGWHFVQRLSHIHTVNVPTHIGSLKELGIRRGWRARDWGWGTIDEKEWGPIRLVTVFERDAQEAWYLVTDLDAECPAEIVRLYKRRMWIEAMFRDLKNRDWGLGLDHVRLSEPERHDRHFIVLALAYAFLCAFGAAAETLNIARLFQANTSRERVLSLARIGNYFIQITQCPLDTALAALATLPT